MATVRWRRRRLLAKHRLHWSTAELARRWSTIAACRSRFCTCSCAHGSHAHQRAVQNPGLEL